MPVQQGWKRRGARIFNLERSDERIFWRIRQVSRARKIAASDGKHTSDPTTEASQMWPAAFFNPCTLAADHVHLFLGCPSHINILCPWRAYDAKGFRASRRVFVAIVAIVAVFAVIAIPHGLKLDREATEYIQETLPKILNQWKAQELIDRATPRLLSTSKPDAINRYFVMFSRLGAFRRIGPPVGSISSSSFSGRGTITVGNYVVPVDFEQGTARIQIQLQHVGDNWEINGFQVSSELLMPSSVTATENTHWATEVVTG